VLFSSGFKAIRTREFLQQDQAHSSDRLTHVVNDIPVLATVNAGSTPLTHLALSCDDLTLATASEDGNIHLYDVRNFASQVFNLYVGLCVLCVNGDFIHCFIFFR